MNRRCLVPVALGCLLCGSAAAQTNESRMVTAADAADGDAYGFSVEVSGDIAIIGAVFDDADTGAAYLVDVKTGAQLHKLTASDAAPGDLFGWSVAIDGNTAVVGAIWNSAGAPGGGAAYVFDVATGQELFRLTAADATLNDRLGVSVDIDGDSILVGAPYDDWAGEWSGSAYVFDRVTGAQIRKIEPADTQPYDLFGYDLAVSGDRALIGAYGDAASGDVTGVAYIFDLTTGAELGQLQPPDIETSDAFAKALDLDGDIAVIGCENDDDDELNSGSAYIYNIATQQMLAKLRPSKPVMLGFFGNAIAVDGDSAVIGQWFGAIPGEVQGRAYLFDLPNVKELAVLEASDREDYDLFGYAVGLSEAAAVVGAYGDDHNGRADAGSAYIYDLADCPPDLNGDGLVNTQDFLAYLNLWVADDPIADWNGDGTVNTQDFLAYLNDWSAGC